MALTCTVPTLRLALEWFACPHPALVEDTGHSFLSVTPQIFPTRTLWGDMDQLVSPCYLETIDTNLANLNKKGIYCKDTRKVE